MQIFAPTPTSALIKTASGSVAIAADKKVSSDADIAVYPLETIKAKSGQAVFDWPGEYEAKGIAVFVQMIGNGDKPLIKVFAESTTVVFLDGIESVFTESEEEQVGSADIVILAVPSDAESQKIAKSNLESLEPSLVILTGTADHKAAFAKLLGFENAPENDNIKIKKADLSPDRMEVSTLK